MLPALRFLSFHGFRKRITLRTRRSNRAPVAAQPRGCLEGFRFVLLPACVMATGCHSCNQGAEPPEGGVPVIRSDAAPTAPLPSESAAPSATSTQQPSSPLSVRCGPEHEISSVRASARNDVSAPPSHILAARALARDRDLQKMVNEAILTPLLRQRDTFAEAWREAPEASRLHAEQDISCKHRFFRRYLVSVGCDSYEHLGGAYPEIGFIAINLWTCGPRPVQIGVGLLCDEPCKERLSGVLHDVLKSRGSEQIWAALDEARREGEDIFQSFVMSDKGLVFSFRETLPHVFDEAGLVFVEFAELDKAMGGSDAYRSIRDAASHGR
jgi:hypothetical protein